jgi:hypothetical protein
MRSLIFGIVAFLVALVLGIGSAFYAIRDGVPVATEWAGPWISWPSEGHPDADIYTRAYLARSGRLPVTSTSVRYFFARTDDQGRPLTSACEYALRGSPLNARWWSLALYDGRGHLIANPSERYSVNSKDVLRRSDGSYRLTLASQARPENWISTGAKRDRPLLLVLRVYELRETDPDGIGKLAPDRLPKIERRQCH